MGAPMGTIMAQATVQTMDIDAVLTLTQWLSPAYPVGAFAYSHGLEWAVDDRQVRDAQSLADWLGAVVCHGAGLADARFLVAAYRADDPARIDALARAFAPSAERLKETVLQGEAFARATTDIWHLSLPGLTYPVAVGRAARLCDLPLDVTLGLYLQAFVSNLTAAGIRLIPLGQTEGQGIVKALMPLCRATADAALTGSLDDLSSTAFLGDIASMKHETQYARIFRT